MADNKKNRFRWDKTDMAAGSILILVFGFFFFFCEVKELSDSFQYLTQSISREPVYSLFMKYSRFLFGENTFRTVVAFLQNALAVAAIFYVQKEIGTMFTWKPIYRIAVVFLLLAPHLMTPLASSTHLILTNSILTEGITFSLYYIWVTALLKALLGKTAGAGNVLFTFFMALFLSLIRGQMMVAILVWGIVMGYVWLGKKNYKMILLCVAAVAMAFFARTYLVRAYNDTQQGFFADTTSSKPMMLANVLYVAEKADAETIEDPVIKALFEEIITKLEQDEKTMKYAKGSLLDYAKFHEDVHDAINFEYASPVIRAYIEKTQGINGSRFAECMIELDKISAQMTKELMPTVAGRFAQNYFIVASLGMIRSIGVEISVIPVFVLAVYLLGIGLALFLWITDKKSKAAHFMLFVLLLICGNVFSSSLMIQCISRYMIYNLPFFYMALGAMVLECLGKNKDKIEAKRRMYRV